MDVTRALDQIAEIHQQIAKGEVYRGYRSQPVAASGLIGLIAAWMQPHSLGDDPIGFVLYWGAIAVAAGFVGSSEIIYNYVVREDTSGRRQTESVLGQFLPSVVAGAALALCLPRAFDGLFVVLLPGLWAICFGLGTFAVRPYLPRAAGWIGIFYSAAGFVLLWTAPDAVTLTGWWVGGVFGVGQLLAALVLWWNLERE